MSQILFDQGKKVGQISDWTVASNEPVYKNVLGKTVLSVPAHRECSFVSPKPIQRKSQLIIVQDGMLELTLQIKKITGACSVTALIVSEKNLSKE